MSVPLSQQNLISTIALQPSRLISHCRWFRASGFLFMFVYLPSRHVTRRIRCLQPMREKLINRLD